MDMFAFAQKTDCIILAGGQGTRLFPLTQTRCKPAVCFGGAYRLIDIPLSHCLHAKLDSIFVITQYLASSLQQHIYETYHFDQFHKNNIQLLSPEETPTRKVWFKGTADSIRQNLEYFEASSAEYFLILSADQLYNMDFNKLFAFAEESNADFIIAALNVKEQEAKRMGVLNISAKKQVLDFFEKPSDTITLKRFSQSNLNSKYLGSMGIYLCKRKTLFNLLKEEGDDFGRHLIPLQVNKGGTYCYQHEEYWEDIGTVLSYYKANLALTQKNHLDTKPIFTTAQQLTSTLIRDTKVINSIIAQGSISEASQITNSVIGMRIKIDSGSIIESCILVGNLSAFPSSSTLPQYCSIGRNCILKKVIVDEHTIIGNNVTLTNPNAINHLDTFKDHGIYIRDGIIIVTSGTKIPNGFTI
ncbi:Glucose-1-phosphate adenylyltransferase [Candidatus Rhabdochlamydia oedothoracis]|uniref:Glucose-1-phosphate adenylyltransferase n=2 Tax=Candidatus Rhabdochlamydiaceae TaxID=689704 RepID=A0ABX8UYD6_9BACT|nr:Glucose-1-phosphate adenylyltransferase [Candidatus Rhabdochlamydia sp. W815]QYF47973.1 Glucose-1-phosphate adenylyltransferase [Candidatus Rhabdochlamydia oedothoracis]